jgi:hypothetical protein
MKNPKKARVQIENYRKELLFMYTDRSNSFLSFFYLFVWLKYDVRPYVLIGVWSGLVVKWYRTGIW